MGALPPKRTTLVVSCVALAACGSGSGGADPLPLPPLPEGLLLDPGDWARIPASGSPGCAAETCGAAWDSVLAWAERWDDPDVFPDLTEVMSTDSDHDVVTLACALAWRGSGDPVWRERARLLLRLAVSSPYFTDGVSALRPGRNLLSYVLAASTIELGDLDPFLDQDFRAWIERVAEVDTWSGDGASGTFRAYHEQRPNNVGLVVGASRLAVDVYLGGDEHARHVAEAMLVFRGFLGDDSAHRFPVEAFGGTREDNSWQPVPARPVGIGPAGATLPGGIDVDGCLPEEMRRLGDLDCADCGRTPSIQCYNRRDSIDGGAPPGIAATGYPWEALQGLVLQAYLLWRCGYDAFDWEERAIERTHRFLFVSYGLRAQDTWNDASQPDDPGCCDGVGHRSRVDDTWVPHVLWAIQAPDFLTEEVLVFGGRPGKNCGFADWWTLALERR
jgi:hypothetical protein